MKNKYFYPIFKLKAKSWIRYWLLKKTEFKGKLSEILTGFSFNLENTLNRKFKLFEIEGNSVQDGSPSPDNEVPILNAGDNGSITEKIVNENYLSLSEATVGTAGVTASISETKMKFSGKMASVTNIFNTIREDKTIPAGTYKLSYKKLSGATSGSGDWAVYFNFYNANGTKIAKKNFASNDIVGGTVKDLVLSEDVAFYNYYAYCNSTSLIFNDLELGFMITKDTPTDYVPHKEQTYTIPTQQPMRSIGDVRDVFFKNTVDSEYYDENLVENGWYERHLKWFRVTKDMIRGAGAYGVNTWVIGAPTLVKYIANTISCKCNYFRGVSHDDRTTAGNNIVYSIPNGTNIEFRNTEFSTRELFEAFLDDNEVYVEYIPVEPTNLLCTTEQTNILENIPSTFAGQTNVYSPDEVKPFLKIQYWESDTNG